MRKQKGFTLIELLVVVTILGILAAIVTFAVLGLTDSANKKACQQEVSTVQAALDADIAQNNLTGVPDMSGGSTWIGVGAQDWSNNPALNPLYSPSGTTFLRNPKTTYQYEYNSTGKLTGIQKGDGSSAPCTT